MAQLELGRYYFHRSSDYEAAFTWFQKSALQGFPRGQYALGYVYESGQGVARNPFEAVKWMHRAAQQGLPGAQVRLAWHFYTGTGVRLDYEKASEWYLRAAELGEEDAHESAVESCESAKTEWEYEIRSCVTSNSCNIPTGFFGCEAWDCQQTNPAPTCAPPPLPRSE